MVETYQKVINRDNFNDTTIRQEYQDNVLKKVQAIVETDHSGKLWNDVVEIRTSTTEDGIVFKKNNRTRQERAEFQT